MASGVIQTLSGGQGKQDRSGTVEVNGTTYPFGPINFGGTKDNPAVGDTVEVTMSGGRVTGIVDNSR